MENLKKTLESIFPQYEKSINMYVYYVQETKQRSFKLENVLLMFFKNTWRDERTGYREEGCILISKDEDKFFISFHPRCEEVFPFRWKRIPSNKEEEVVTLVKLIWSKTYEEVCSAMEKNPESSIGHYGQNIASHHFSDDWKIMIRETKRTEPVLA